MSKQNQEGLEWDNSGLDLEPRWTREPQLDAIARVCRKVLAISDTDSCKVSAHASGAFNKLYLVEGPKGQSLMRISLPVDPTHKILGEVTTLRWIRSMTNVPVPEVIAFDDSRDNEIGFEWILMELMPGTSAYNKWRNMTMAGKISLVEQVADFQNQLFRCSLDAQFRGVGTLSPIDKDSDPTGTPKPARIVSRFFFWGRHINYDLARGPFRSSHDWLSAYLEVIRKEHSEALVEAEDDDDREDAEDYLRVVGRLTTLLPKIFPSLQNPDERTVLWHDDLSLQNILVDDSGKITALIDWECVSTNPLWVAADMPKFLVGSPREEEPQRDRYADASEGSGHDTGNGEPEEDKLDNGGKTELYWIDLLEYEQTQLRGVYAAKLGELWQQWKVEADDRSLKADFLGAVVRCASGWYRKRIEQWIDCVEDGKYPRLTSILRPGNG